MISFKEAAALAPHNQRPWPKNIASVSLQAAVVVIPLICLSVTVCLCLSAVCLCLSVYLYLFVCLSVCQSVSLCLSVDVCCSLFCLSVCTLVNCMITFIAQGLHKCSPSPPEKNLRCSFYACISLHIGQGKQIHRY